MTWDAIVIGGGPSGSSAAIALAGAGLGVALVEKAGFPRRKVCGEFLSAASIPVLAELGVAEAWSMRAGPPIRRVGLFAGDRVVSARMPSGPGHGRALGRDVLDTILLDQARAVGVEVFQPWRVEALTQSPRGHRAEIVADGATRTLEAPVVVVAHGSWERGPLRTNAPRSGAPRDLLGFKAYFTGGNLPDDLMPLLSFPGGYGGMVTADGGRVSISCCIRRDALAHLRRTGETAGDAVERHVTASCRGVREALEGAVRDGPWLGAGPIRPGRRPGSSDGIFRVGNLAMEAHPVVAEGISMSLQSGILAGRHLAGIDIRDPAHRLGAAARYARAIRMQFGLRIVAASAIGQAAMWPNAFAGLARLVDLAPGLLTLGARISGKSKPIAPV